MATIFVLHVDAGHMNQILQLLRQRLDLARQPGAVAAARHLVREALDPR